METDLDSSGQETASRVSVPGSQIDVSPPGTSFLDWFHPSFSVLKPRVSDCAFWAEKTRRWTLHGKSIYF